MATKHFNYMPPVEAEAESRRMWCFRKVLRVEKELREGSAAWLSDFSVSKYCPTLSRLWSN